MTRRVEVESHASWSFRRSKSAPSERRPSAWKRAGARLQRTEASTELLPQDFQLVIGLLRGVHHQFHGGGRRAPDRTNSLEVSKSVEAPEAAPAALAPGPRFLCPRDCSSRLRAALSFVTRRLAFRRLAARVPMGAPAAGSPTAVRPCDCTSGQLRTLRTSKVSELPLLIRELEGVWLGRRRRGDPCGHTALSNCTGSLPAACVLQARPGKRCS